MIVVRLRSDAPHASRVRNVAPPGLGTWELAWERVEQPSGAFLDALAPWEQTGSKEHREAVQHAANALESAWKRLGREYRAGGIAEAAGRPTARAVGDARRGGALCLA